MYYTGIGSRQTPLEVMNLITILSHKLCKKYILRSGAASGADTAFENGCNNNSEIWIPWKNFNNHNSINLPNEQSFKLAEKYHPVWDKLTDGAKKLHARNCHQVLGKDLKTPSKFLICWTEYGEIKGGTATAIKLAKDNFIPILNLGKYTNITNMYDAFLDFMILNGENYEI